MNRLLVLIVCSLLFSGCVATTAGYAVNAAVLGVDVLANIDTKSSKSSLKPNTGEVIYTCYRPNSGFIIERVGVNDCPSDEVNVESGNFWCELDSEIFGPIDYNSCIKVKAKILVAESVALTAIHRRKCEFTNGSYVFATLEDCKLLNGFSFP